MARIRTIKPSFFRSRKIDQLTDEQKLTFIGLWTHVDDSGRCEYDPELIKADIWPRRRSVEEVEYDLAVLTELSLISHYVVDDRSYLVVNGWEEHQRINRPTASRLPDPSEGRLLSMTRENESTGNTHCGLTADSPPEGNKEGKGREEELAASADAQSLLPKPSLVRKTRRYDYTSEFEEAWTAYGKKGDKAQAFVEWDKAVARTDRAVVLAAIPRYLAANRDPKFRKDFCRWLAGDVWESVPAAANGEVLPPHHHRDPKSGRRIER